MRAAQVGTTVEIIASIEPGSGTALLQMLKRNLQKRPGSFMAAQAQMNPRAQKFWLSHSSFHNREALCVIFMFYMLFEDYDEKYSIYSDANFVLTRF